jgi:hypothetical protein
MQIDSFATPANAFSGLVIGLRVGLWTPMAHNGVASQHCRVAYFLVVENANISLLCDYNVAFVDANQ